MTGELQPDAPQREVEASAERPPSSAWARLGAGAVGIAAFSAALVVARSLGRDAVQDLRFWDEAMYLRFGADLFRHGPPPATWGPAYAVWYWLESLIVPDPVTRAYFNWSALLFANLLALGLLLRRLGFGSVVGVAVLSVAAVLHWSEPLLTDVVLFAAALVGFALVATLGGGSPSRRLATAAVALAVAAFARPELTAAWAATTAAGAYAALREEGRPAARWAKAAIPVVALAALLVAFGNPLSSKRFEFSAAVGERPGRSFEAFGQHYAVNLERMMPTGADPWFVWAEVVARDFDGATSVGEAARRNPAAFLRHVGWNARLLAEPRTFLAPLRPYLPVAPALGEIAAWLLALAVAAGAALGLAYAALDLTRAARAPRTASAWPTVLVAASVVASVTASSLVVFPREHYFATAFVAVVALAACGYRRLLASAAPAAPGRRGTVALVAAVCVLAALPARPGGVPWYLHALGSGPPAPELPVLAAVRDLRTLHPAPRRIRVFEGNVGYGAYSGWDYEFVFPSVCTPLARCVAADSGVDVILVDARLAQYYAQNHDPDFERLVYVPSSLGFSGMAFPRSRISVFVRNGALAR